MKKTIALIVTFIVLLGGLVFGYLRERKNELQKIDKLPIIISAGETTTTPSPSAKPAPILSAQEKTELKILLDKYNYTKTYDFSTKTEKQISGDTSLLTYADNQKLFEAYNNYLVNNGMAVNGNLPDEIIKKLNELTK